MLSIVATPLGNLEDISIRQGRIILDADYILAENTQTTGKLLPQLEEIFERKKIPSQSVIRYSKETEMEVAPRVLEYLREGKEVAIISEAGSPLISDPGYLIVNQAVKEQIPMTVIPGPVAFVTTIQLSGFSFKHLCFIGFLPKKKGELEKIMRLCYETHNSLSNTIFAAYESPERINETLLILSTIYPETDIVIARELTKKFEEVIRGKPAELSKRMYKGEISLVFRFSSVK